MIREHVQNEAVSNMLIKRIQDKQTPEQRPPLINKKQVRPNSSGVKYLNKVALTQAPRRDNDSENKAPLINMQRQTYHNNAIKLIPVDEDYMKIERCYYDNDSFITPRDQANEHLPPSTARNKLDTSLDDLESSRRRNKQPFQMVNPLRQSNSNLSLFSFILDKSPYTAPGSKPL